MDDPRLAGPLRAVVFDSEIADEVRLAAYDVLDGVSAYLSDEEQRLVWATGHPGFDGSGSRSLRDAEIVLPIAGDPSHVLYSRSLDALVFGFESHQDLAIAALENGDPNIRASACKTLLYEEAIGATPGLIQCLDDPDTDVRTEAENALQYFHDRRVFGVCCRDRVKPSIPCRRALRLHFVSVQNLPSGWVISWASSSGTIPMTTSLTAARARGRVGGRPPALTPDKLTVAR